MTNLSRRDFVALEILKKMLNDSDRVSHGFASTPDFGETLIKNAFGLSDQFLAESKRRMEGLSRDLQPTSKTVIDFDARKDGYEADDVRQLVARIRGVEFCNATILVVRQAHMLTTEASSVLNDFLEKTPGVLCLLFFTEETLAFPPLLRSAVVIRSDV